MLNKLSGLSSPPLPFTPLIILSSNELEGDMEAIRVAAPKAVVRGGVDDTWTLTNQNRVFVLDRCGRMVYQQSLHRSDTNLLSVQAAILSAHLDEPCGPCHLPSQQDELQQINRGHLDEVDEKQASQSKMSGIANAYAPSNVARPTHTSVVVTAEEAPNNAEETHDEETTRKPERKKKKKDKKKRNKGNKYQKEKKRKWLTSTSKPIECDCGLNDPNVDARGCECVGQYIPSEGDRLDIQIPDSPDTMDQDLAILNEILEDRENAFLASTDSPAVQSSIVWPTDKREKKQKNGKRNRMDLQHEIDEGIEIVREDEEIVEYPETIDFYVEVEDNVVADTEQEDEGDLYGRGDHDLVNHGIMGNARDHLLGRGDHDLVNHGIMGNARDHLLGRGDHDLVNHGTMGNARDHLLGRGDHDLVNHGTMGNARDHLLGRGDHDLVNHGTMGNARDHLLGRGDHDLVNHGIIGSERQGRSHLEDSFEVYREDDKQTEREDEFWKSVERKKKEKKTQDLPKKGNENKKTRVESEEAENGAWVGSDETGSREFALRWPTETAPRVATWRDATAVPATHDARSSGDSEDQTRRVVMYESEGGDQSQSWDESVGGKDALLHSKVQPWSKGKRY